MIKMAIYKQKQRHNFCQCSSKFRDYIVVMREQVPTYKIKIDQGPSIDFALHLNFSLIWLTEELGVPRVHLAHPKDMMKLHIIAY